MTQNELHWSLWVPGPQKYVNKQPKTTNNSLKGHYSTYFWGPGSCHRCLLRNVNRCPMNSPVLGLGTESKRRCSLSLSLSLPASLPSCVHVYAHNYIYIYAYFLFIHLQRQICRYLRTLITLVPKAIPVVSCKCEFWFQEPYLLYLTCIGSSFHRQYLSYPGYLPNFEDSGSNGNTCCIL